MIFWTIVAIAVIIAIYIAWKESGDSYGMPVLGAFMSLFFGGMAAGLSLLTCFFLPINKDLVSDNTYQLKALGNNNAIEGRSYFLGGGYINDKRVLNFISQRDGGAIHVEQAEADDSVIYEGSTDATVQVQHYDWNNGWIATWPLGSGDEYTFRIPTGSVVESYTLDNQ